MTEKLIQMCLEDIREMRKIPLKDWSMEEKGEVVTWMTELHRAGVQTPPEWGPYGIDGI